MSKVRTWEDLDLNDQVIEHGPSAGHAGASWNRRLTEPESKDSPLHVENAAGSELTSVPESTQGYQGIVYEFEQTEGKPPASPKPVKADITCRACGIEQPLPVRDWNQVRPAISAAGWIYGPGGTLRETWCPQCRHIRESE